MAYELPRAVRNRLLGGEIDVALVTFVSSVAKTARKR